MSIVADKVMINALEHQMIRLGNTIELKQKMAARFPGHHATLIADIARLEEQQEEVNGKLANILRKYTVTYGVSKYVCTNASGSFTIICEGV